MDIGERERRGELTVVDGVAYERAGLAARHAGFGPRLRPGGVVNLPAARIYYGTDDLYLNYLARFVKPGGPIGIAGAGLVGEIEGPLPEHLRQWWTQDCWLLHSESWWRRHWERTGIVDIVTSDTMPDGWQRWLDWHRTIAPDNEVEIQALESDRGSYLGYNRLVGRRRGQTKLADQVVSLPARYVKKPLLRGDAG